MPGTAEPLILKTKLHSPRLDEGRVARARLVEAFTEHRDTCLTLVSAPAGYGKSTLAAEWTAADSRPAAWVCLDDSDNDLRVFLRYVAAAVESLFPESCPLTSSVIEVPELPSVRVLAGQLANELDAIGEAFILVLDDYHEIQEPAIHDLLSELLRHPPLNVHWLITTRRDPPLPLASLRAGGRMHEIRFDELQFSAPEAGALMEKLLSRPLSAGVVSRVAEMTEGWVAGLQLVALACRHRPDPESFLIGLKGSIRDIQDYLIAEVLSRETPESSRCILKTSVVDRFSAGFCEGVCEKRDECPLAGTGMIGGLADKGLFMIPLDAECEWFRYHQLFRDLLRRQLEKEVGANGVADLHGRASSWFESLGFNDEAIDHALKSGNPSRAAEILEAHRKNEYNADRFFEVQRWLRRIPADAKKGRPATLLAEAWDFYTQLRLTEIAVLLEQAESTLPAGGRSEGLLGEINLLRAVLTFWTGDGQGVLEFAAKASRQLPPDFIFARAELEIYRGLGLQIVGRAAEALEELEKRIQNGADSHPMFLSRRTATIGFIELLSGQTQLTRHAALRLRDVSEKNDLPYANIWASYLHGSSSFQGGELEEGLRHFQEVSDKRHIFHRQGTLSGLAGLALAFQALDRCDEADHTLGLLHDYALETGDPASLATADSCRARVFLWRGDRAAAARSIPQLGDDADFPSMIFFIEIPVVTKCRVLLATGGDQDVASAAKQLANLRMCLKGLHNVCQLVDVIVLEALAHELMGKPGAAAEALEEALKLAEPGWWVRPFLEVGGQVAAILGRLDVTENATEFVRQLRAALAEDKTTPAKEPATIQPLFEPLTNREIDVLELIAERLYDKEIADRLSISPGTVKSHLKHIYQKLEVGNRRAAVEKAKALQII